jgi:hypothetical protein
VRTMEQSMTDISLRKNENSWFGFRDHTCTVCVIPCEPPAWDGVLLEIFEVN